MYNQYIIYNFV